MFVIEIAAWVVRSGLCRIQSRGCSLLPAPGSNVLIKGLADVTVSFCKSELIKSPCFKANSNQNQLWCPVLHSQPLSYFGVFLYLQDLSFGGSEKGPKGQG